MGTGQDIGRQHSSSSDEPGLYSHPATRRTYGLRGRIRCRYCQRRIAGSAPRPQNV